MTTTASYRSTESAGRRKAGRAPGAGAGRNVAEIFLKRSRRALDRIAETASSKSLAEFAGADTDAGVLLRALGAALLTELKDEPLAGARLRGAKMQKRLLGAAEGVSSRDFAAALGVTPQAVNKARRAGACIGLPVGEQFTYPLVQLKDGQVVRGLKETLAALQVEGAWSRLSFLMGEDATLGARPIDALKTGRIDEVVAAAGRYGEHGAP